MYPIQDTHGKRSASFGYGTKYDFTRAKNTAPYYNLPTDFDPKKSNHPKYSFGISRSYYEKVITYNIGLL
jgi:hypothetical protein